MSSFLEDIPQHIIDAEMQEVAEQLLADWFHENLNEGQFYSDYRFAEMSDSKMIKEAFNKFYEIGEEDEHYLD